MDSAEALAAGKKAAAIAAVDEFVKVSLEITFQRLLSFCCLVFTSIYVLHVHFTSPHATLINAHYL